MTTTATLVFPKSAFLHRYPVGAAHSGKNGAVDLNVDLVIRFRACCLYLSHPSVFNIRAKSERQHSEYCKRGFNLLQFENSRIIAHSNIDENISTGPGGSGGSDGEISGGIGGSGDLKIDKNSWSYLNWYNTLLAKFPLLTKAVTSALLTLIGDLICQRFFNQVSEIDRKRAFLFSVMGLVMVGPMLHYWYLFLNKLITFPRAQGAILCLVLDQFLFSPIFIGLFLSMLVSLEGKFSQVVPKLQQEWFSSVLASWKLWIPFQFLNFRYVPPQLQVLAANLVALIWNVILSLKAHKEVLPS